MCEFVHVVAGCERPEHDYLPIARWQAGLGDHRLDMRQEGAVHLGVIDNHARENEVLPVADQFGVGSVLERRTLGAGCGFQAHLAEQITAGCAEALVVRLRLDLVRQHRQRIIPDPGLGIDRSE